MANLLQLPSELQDSVLILLCARDLLRLRATCSSAARIVFSKEAFLRSRARCLRDRFVVIVRRFLAYRKVERFLSDRTWWEYGQEANTETARNTDYHWEVLLGTQALVTHGFSVKLPDANPASILDHLQGTTGMVGEIFNPSPVFRVLYATEVGGTHHRNII